MAHWKTSLSVALPTLASLGTGLAMPTSDAPLPRQTSVDTSDPTQQYRLDAIRDTFLRSWRGYRKFAWGHDSLRPLSGTWEDDRNGWGASAIDGLSTAIILGETEVILDVLEYVPTINWLNTTEVSLFETTIRYLGGLISAYDMLKGPYANLLPKESQILVDALLEQAVKLADYLKIAFDTKSGVPDNGVVFQPYLGIKNATTNGLAVTGTLVLEWERLSDLTGNPEYGRLARGAESYLLKPKPALAEPFPGLVGTNIYTENGTFADNRGSWSGGTDSFYEYLIKMWIYDPIRYYFYKERWVAAADSSIKYLASHPTARPDLTFLASFEGETRFFESGHLACFAGGNFILGGLVLDEQRYVDFGLELTASCHETYVQTTTGIGPEWFAWMDDAHLAGAFNNPWPPADQLEFYERAGFWIRGGSYFLRPEVIESFYYAYRATGYRVYRDWAWDAFLSINRTCLAGEGMSSIASVNPKDDTVEYTDFQESFWFAEVMKYSYLIQMDSDDSVHIQRDGKNKWVYNTEAHPFLVFDPNRDNRTVEDERKAQ